LLGRAKAIITGWGNSGKTDELLTFFKTLAEPQRLKIVGLLAQQSYTGEQLAALLNLSVSTTSHHLNRLTKAGLVTAQAEGYYSVYSLHTEVLSAMARRLLSKKDLPKLAQEVDRTSSMRTRPSCAEVWSPIS
jgi:DNA-binding transcriptional ArsR family regulator